MIQLSKWLLLLLVLLSINLRSQDLYDLEHSKDFARYLFNSKQFSEAAREYERVVFLDSSDFDSRYHLVQSYRFAGQYEMALHRMDDFSSLRPLDLSLPFSREYPLSLMATGRYIEGRQYILGSQSLSRLDKNELYLGSLLAQADWPTARIFADTAFNTTSALYTELLAITMASQDLKHRSPALALSMSVLVPGSGKAYAGEWKDGIISLLFVASNAYQSYRGFSSDGVSSAYGWIFGSLAVGFYGGNLYGTLQSVKRFNRKQNAPFQDRAHHLLFDIP